ncbi:hypothetical protein HAV22_14070 [Massilia sp. TW-1]|uniref:Uncharacterized protein n=1 Tax=Telluria antibiotica TaxID=2717319 RepID=A0ABX0PD07_9BURK|nr:phage integrase SAM-like domain-containing protein [Telluria antibiotica]NIA54761.1 hypothetical protein [Telluria antibiotica]
MATRKNFKARELLKNDLKINFETHVSNAIILLDRPTLSWRKIDMSARLNHGVDEWVFNCESLLRLLLKNKSVFPSTVVTYWISFRHFLDFLIEYGSSIRPQDIDRSHINEFIKWLGVNGRGWSVVTQKATYSGTKAVLTSMFRYGFVAGSRNIFPPNPYPGSNNASKGEKELSENERARLAQMLRKEIILIHKGTFDGVEAEALTILATALAMRTGLNPTSLLELRRDSLRPHPFMPNMMLLESFKRRGNATHLTSLRYSVSASQFASIPMDGVALFKMVLSRNQILSEKSKDKTIRQSLWVYRQASRKREITLLSTAVMSRTIQRRIDKYGLTSDDGGRLVINFSRLRKTLENRLWSLSGGDLFAVASVMGHTPDVADTHYLSCTDEMRANATFVGEALPDIYRGSESPNLSNVAIKALPENTPVGSCHDTIYGEYAPKDGKTHCSDFLSCFSCRSYAIVGSEKDLHRLFSFYWFLQAEIENGRSSDWRAKFRSILDLIDSFTVEKFDSEILSKAKTKAKVDPIKFWKTYQIAGESANR